MSLPPSLGRMKPKPRAGSYHLTTPSNDSVGPAPSSWLSRLRVRFSRGGRGAAVEGSSSMICATARPLGPCVHSKTIDAPSGASLWPDRSSADSGRKTSPPPSLGTMNPNPLLRLNHLILPVRRKLSPDPWNVLIDAP